jgi:hypothetical protein
VFTDKRVIVAQAGIHHILAYGRWWSFFRAKEEKRMVKALRLRTPQEILESDKRNREIPYDRILKVKLKMAPTRCILRIICMNGRKDSFSLPKDRFRRAKEILCKVLKDKVEVEL